jgi:hypothetical protein
MRSWRAKGTSAGGVKECDSCCDEEMEKQDSHEDKGDAVIALSAYVERSVDWELQ